LFGKDQIKLAQLFQRFLCGQYLAGYNALPHGKSFFVRFKPLFSSNAKRVSFPRPQLRLSALERERNMAFVQEKEEDVS
jgi:hypothetical protein